MECTLSVCSSQILLKQSSQKKVFPIALFVFILVKILSMEEKFNSFVTTFYLSLEDEDYVKAREQVTIMKSWYNAFEESIRSLDDIPENKEIRAKSILFKQVSVNLSSVTSR